ncbi:hypothetical protein BN946_scf184650.g5 [Trametes cinnabarina]|uniref:F-box domain-containing protein n=1 Tax=Pycnoporus cinnabarinus TaxID=5643 RepID=A0A060S6D1_PYCCI|nr:hypothetical protein BN946_scf184650.g5 [Trametes cinnabarina]
MASRGATATVQDTIPQALVLALGPSRDIVSATDDGKLLTLGTYPVECIPRLAPFALSLSHLGMRHKPVVVQYRQGSTTPLLRVSLARCRLESALQLPLLQQLFRLRDITSYDIEIPICSAQPLRKMKATFLTTELILRGELPFVIQFLAALEAESLGRLVVHFSRNQFDSSFGGTNIDCAYTLQLHPHLYAQLRAVRLCENEPFPRYSDIPLACILRPLFSLQRLEDVELVLAQSPMCARDYDVTQIARAWPGARRLVFACEECVGGAPTLDSLYVLADHCPGLRELLLPQLDVRRLGHSIEKRPPRVPPRDKPTHPLRKFGVACDSRTNISDQQAGNIARCIDSLFPNIDVKESWVHDDSAETILGDWYLIWVNLIATKAFRAVVPSRVSPTCVRAFESLTCLQAYLDRSVSFPGEDFKEWPI